MPSTALVRQRIPPEVIDAVGEVVEEFDCLDVQVEAERRGGNRVRTRARMVCEILENEGLLPQQGQQPELQHVIGALGMLKARMDMIRAQSDEDEDSRNDKYRPAMTRRSYEAKHQYQTLEMTRYAAEREGLIRATFMGKRR